MVKLRTQPNKTFQTNVFGKNISFVNLSNEPTYIQSRVLRIQTKEPETIEWIDSIPATDNFFDVGANIGIYTMCAGAKGLKTYAFEPHSGNYYVLNQNITLNKFPCVAFCIGLSNKSSLDILGIKNHHPGVSDNVVNDTMDQSHGVVTYELDHLVSNGFLPQPDHIKIDIDGHEEKFYQGAKQTLAKCKSILFEIENQYEYIVDELQTAGFKLTGKHKRNEQEHNFIFRK